jgi:hypothetical protein
MSKTETAATSSADSSEFCGANDSALDLAKESAAGLDPSSSSLITKQCGGVVSSILEMPREEYPGLDIASMLASGSVPLPTMPADGMLMDQTFIQFPQNRCLSSAKNPMEWQSQSEVSTAPTSGVSETPTSEVSAPPGLEDQIPIPIFLTRQVHSESFKGRSPDHVESEKISNAIALCQAARQGIASPEPMYIVPQIAFMTPATPTGEDARPAKIERQDLDSADDHQKDSVDIPQVLCIVEGHGILSVGSLDHSTGTCKPCAFFRSNDANSCQNGTACLFCHTCPPTESKARKKRAQRWRNLVAHQHNATVLERTARNPSMKSL